MSLCSGHFSAHSSDSTCHCHSLAPCGNTTAAHAPLPTGPLHTEPSVKTITLDSLCCSMNFLTVYCCCICPSEDLLYTSLLKMSRLAILVSFTLSINDVDVWTFNLQPSVAFCNSLLMILMYWSGQNITPTLIDYATFLRFTLSDW